MPIEYLCQLNISLINRLVFRQAEVGKYNEMVSLCFTRDFPEMRSAVR